LDTKRKELAIATMPAEIAEDDVNGEMKEQSPPLPEVNGNHESSDESDEEPPVRRQLRGGADRTTDRKRKRDEAEAARKEKKAKAAAPKLTKEEQELKKVIEDLDKLKDNIKSCEDHIADINNDLRETECQRTKCLGRDRFCNRYYWFERNGMPFGGVPETSTSHYGYANGRIWVQGPDGMERDGFIDLPNKEQQQYKDTHGVTVLERKEQEEGPSHLHDSEEWAYIDEADAVDQLIGWLDERGNRERSLRKELQSWRDPIVDCMHKMRTHLDELEAKKAAADEEQQATATRVSTRTKTYVDLESTKWQCLAWHNSTAEREVGCIHSEGVKAKGRKRGAAEKKEKIPLGKNGKPLTRQGTNYRGR
jgi:Williams-Beuren syndrome DDT (WSD), D-TOX E motif